MGARVIAAVGPGTRTGQQEGRLTAAELAVLRELPSLLSLREVAEERAVSVNTVKAQVLQVYRKLGVTGRRDAVVTARRRGLL